MSRKANEFTVTPSGTIDDFCNMAQPSNTSSLDLALDFTFGSKFLQLL